MLVVIRDDRRGIRPADELALDLAAPGVAKALDAHGELAALEDRVPAERLDRLLVGHRIRASVAPAASAAAKKSGSSRPIERVGSPLAA